MALIARREDDPGQQACEAFGEVIAILLEQVGGELVDRDGDDQLRRRPERGAGRAGLSPRAGVDVGMRGAGLGSGRKPGAGAVWAIAGAAAVANRAAAISAFIEGTRVTKPPPL
jgi:hypothetical protein